jgi:hypothetical protein
MKLKQLILVSLFSGAALAGKAQVTDSVKAKSQYPHQHSGGISIGVTYRKYNPGPLNDALFAAGLHNLSTNHLWYTLDFSHIYCNKFITEFGIGFAAPSSATQNDVKVTLNQGEIYYRVGYIVAASPNFRLFPFAGVNLSNNYLTIKDNPGINSTSDFTEELLTKTTSKTMRQTDFGLELGAGFDYLIKLKPKNTGCFQVERVLPLGIKVGRYFQTSAGDWKINSNSLSGSPDEKYSRFFVSLTIGLGYSIKK